MKRRWRGAGSCRTRIEAVVKRSAPTATRLAGLALAILVVTLPGRVAAQEPRTAPATGRVNLTAGIVADDEPSTLVFFNRPIVSLRARALGRRPSERTAAAVRVLDDLVGQGVTGPIELRPFDGGVMVEVGSRTAFALTSVDIDELSGETLDGVGQQTVVHLQQALAEAREARAPGVLLFGAALALLALSATGGVLWLIARGHGAVTSRLIAASERNIAKSGLADLDVLRASRLFEFQQRFASIMFVVAGLIVAYIGITYTLRRFPFTRPWGESMTGFMLTTIENLAAGMLRAVPGLFTVLLIAMIARFMARLIRLWFDAVERGQVTARWIYPDTAQPTRRLLTTLLWLFAIVMAYPYLPGSQTEAFKGVSVFVGLMVTLGSSGLVNQIMSSFMITYSRALRLGDFIRAGDVEGTVTHLGILSTKLKTVFGEEVTVPNAVIIASTITDYSRSAELHGAVTQTSVTIGYDTPWRQVQALLLLAAARTPGLRREPKPHVLQMSLDDYYVKYTLCVCLEDQHRRLHTLHALHAQIQDLFNDYGVQIMSPNYVLDPKTPKVVAKKDWFAAPAASEPDSSDSADA